MNTLPDSWGDHRTRLTVEYLRDGADTVLIDASRRLEAAMDATAAVMPHNTAVFFYTVEGTGVDEDVAYRLTLTPAEKSVARLADGGSVGRATLLIPDAFYDKHGRRAGVMYTELITASGPRRFIVASNGIFPMPESGTALEFSPHIDQGGSWHYDYDFPGDASTRGDAWLSERVLDIELHRALSGYELAAQDPIKPSGEQAA